MMGWRSVKSGVVHAHGMMVGSESNWTACKRVKLWEMGTLGIREGYEYFHGEALEPGQSKCAHCMRQVQSRMEWIQEWLEG